MLILEMTSRWRTLLIAAAGLLAVGVLGLAGMIVLIRSGLQRYSDEAMARFPGDRIEALTAVVNCENCPIEDRNHAVWALGQMVAVPALETLKKHYDGRPCTHNTRLCQYELKKAIHLIEARPPHPSAAWARFARLHQPWR